MSGFDILQNDAVKVTNAALTAFNAALQKGMNSDVPVWHPQVAMSVTSTTDTELYAWLSQVAGFRKWTASRHFNSVAQSGYQLKNEDWEDSVEIDRNAFRDNKFLQQSQLFEMMGYNARKHPDEQLADILINFASYTCWDGKAYFATDHPVNLHDSGAGTFGNKATNPLTPANLAIARREMMKFKDPSGRKLAVPPDTLIVPPSLRTTAETIVNGIFVPTVSGATVQFVGNGNGAPTQALKLIEIPELEDEPTVWYLARLSYVVKPLIFQKRTDPVVEFIEDLTSAFCKKHKKVQLGADYSGAFGYTFPQLMYRLGDSGAGVTLT